MRSFFCGMILIGKVYLWENCRSMGSVFDYLDWRGDISIKSVGINDIDMVIFCCLSYLKWDDIVPAEPGRMISVSEAARIYSSFTDGEREKRPFHVEGDEELLKALVNSRRFAEVRAGSFVDRFDKETQKQFSAITFLLPTGDKVVAFRGTDRTLIGWKEDFNMGFLDELPSQREAVGYLEAVAPYVLKKLYVCGHSKGGNLALYASAFCSRSVRRRIAAVRNFDGPGFTNRVLATNEFLSVRDRMKTFMPQGSLVGILLEHTEDYRVVKSNAQFMKQHNLYSWEMLGGGFVECGELTESSRIIDAALQKWVSDMTAEQREKLVDGLYSVFEATGAEEIHDVISGKNTLTMIGAYGKLDQETKDLVTKACRLFVEAYKASKKEISRKDD